MTKIRFIYLYLKSLLSHLVLDIAQAFLQTLVIYPLSFLIFLSVPPLSFLQTFQALLMLKLMLAIMMVINTKEIN